MLILGMIAMCARKDEEEEEQQKESEHSREVPSSCPTVNFVNKS